MPSHSFNSLPDHCVPTNDFLLGFSSTFGTCVPTPLAFISTALGTLSIISWLFAQIPQIFKNYSLNSTSGLSLWFLLEWCAGDTTNLLGAILTSQAAWQVVVAGYYVSVDIVLVSQWLWYTHYKPWREAMYKAVGARGGEDSGNVDGALGQVLEGVSPVQSISESRFSNDNRLQREDCKDSAKPIPATVPKVRKIPFSSTLGEKATPSSSHRSIKRHHQASPSPGPLPKTLLIVSMLCVVLATASPVRTLPTTTSKPALEPLPNHSEFAGRILSWTSTLLYLGSRLPQLYKNHTRRSTSGLSPTLFIAAFFGNLFYSTSLLTNPCAWTDFPPYGGGGWAGSQGSDRWRWCKLAAPFWLGAAGVLGLDASVGVQFLMFGQGVEEKVLSVGDERGRSKWRKVSGWMRGWVPSVSPSRVVDADEEGRPLRGGEERRDYGTA
ncbi:MAG: hypothetical protein M1830_010327 [Pleopsidium flavum]|nr:MAG: hypothetical protein M1830_010327 [Pleopsidium flavum]